MITFPLPKISCNHDTCAFSKHNDGLQSGSHICRRFSGFATIRAHEVLREMSSSRLCWWVCWWVVMWYRGREIDVLEETVNGSSICGNAAASVLVFDGFQYSAVSPTGGSCAKS